jgi:hypothetical protein
MSSEAMLLPVGNPNIEIAQETDGSGAGKPGQNFGQRGKVKDTEGGDMTG